MELSNYIINILIDKTIEIGHSNWLKTFDESFGINHALDSSNMGICWPNQMRDLIPVRVDKDEDQEPVKAEMDYHFPSAKTSAFDMLKNPIHPDEPVTFYAGNKKLLDDNEGRYLGSMPLSSSRKSIIKDGSNTPQKINILTGPY